jgi:hypothetical protein
VDGELSATKTRLTTEEGKLVAILVMEEMATARPNFVLMRGAQDKPGEPVTAATPEILPVMAPDAPKNRLALARWLEKQKKGQGMAPCPLNLRARFFRAISGYSCSLRRTTL